MPGKMPEISVNLKLNSAAFEKGFAKAQKSLNKFDKNSYAMNKSLTKIGNSLSRVGTLAVTAFAGFISYKLISGLGAVSDNMDKIAKNASKLNISTEALVGLQHAAEQTGVATTVLDTSLQRMVRRISEVNATGKGVAKGALEELGISVEKLAALKPEEQLGRIGDAMQGLSSQGDKVRIAMALFDTEGVAMVNMLKDGSTGLQAMAADADYLGVTFNDRTAKGIENANDASARLGKAFEGLQQRITERLAPSLEVLNNMATDLVVLFGRHLPGSAKVGADGITSLARVGVKAMKFLGKSIVVIAGMLSTVSQGFAQIGLSAKLAGSKMKGIGSEIAVGLGLSTLKEIAPHMDKYAKDADRIKLAMKGVAAETDKAYKSMGEGMVAVDNISIKFKEYKETINSATGTTTNFGKGLDKLKKKAGKAGKSLKKLSKTSKSSSKSITKELKAINDKLKEFAFDKIGDGFTKIFRQAMDGAMSFKDVMGDVIKEILTQMFRVMVVQKAIAAFSSPLGFSGMGDNGFMFANGGVLHGRTKVGNNVLGEVGDEAVLPIHRMSNGEMGVKAGSSSVEVNVMNYGNQQVQVEDNNGKIDIIIGKVVDQIQRGGAVGNAIQQRYGLSRT